jgi:hypothetical protein
MKVVPLRLQTTTSTAWHIHGITALAIAFVVVGGLIRLGGRLYEQQQKPVALRVKQPGLGAELFLSRRIVHAGAQL